MYKNNATLLIIERESGLPFPFSKTLHKYVILKSFPFPKAKDQDLKMRTLSISSFLCLFFASSMACMGGSNNNPRETRQIMQLQQDIEDLKRHKNLNENIDENEDYDDDYYDDDYDKTQDYQNQINELEKELKELKQKGSNQNIQTNPNVPLEEIGQITTSVSDITQNFLKDRQDYKLQVTTF